MNTTPDRLDEAIDEVSKRLARVEGNPALVAQIIGALPERAAWFGWKSRFALAAVVLAATIGVVLRTLDGRPTEVLRTEGSSTPFVELRAAIERTFVEPELIVRRTPVERPSNDRRTTEDFDRSLAPLSSPAPLALWPAAPTDFRDRGALVVEPLAIPDLPLTAETISPR